jgi:hypothetical protein
VILIVRHPPNRGGQLNKLSGNQHKLAIMRF